MAPKPKRPDYTGSLASYKQSVTDKPKNLDLPSPTDVVNWASGIVASGRMAAGQTQPLTPGDQGLRTLGQGISLANTYLNPYANTTRKALGAAVNRDRQSLTALSKSAALDVAITGAAIGAGKGVQAIANTGIPARIGNIVKRETVVLHGSPVKGLSEITPQIRAYPGQYPDITAKVFMANPRTENSVGTALSYSRRSGMNKQTGGIFNEPGSVYIGKVKTKDIKSPQNLPFKIADIFSTEKPVKVLKEIPTPKFIPNNELQYKSFLQSSSEIEKSLKVLGSPKAKPYKWKYYG